MDIQGDTSGCGEHPVDFKTKVPFWPGLSWPGQSKTELLFLCQREEVCQNLMCHPVEAWRDYEYLVDRCFVIYPWAESHRWILDISHEDQPLVEERLALLQFHNRLVHHVDKGARQADHDGEPDEVTNLGHFPRNWTKYTGEWQLQ